MVLPACVRVWLAVRHARGRFAGTFKLMWYVASTSLRKKPSNSKEYGKVTTRTKKAGMLIHTTVRGGQVNTRGSSFPSWSHPPLAAPVWIPSRPRTLASWPYFYSLESRPRTAHARRTWSSARPSLSRLCVACLPRST
eukprot:scaffold50049_cov31-Tisochrysis_lutea.AAC.4